MKHLTSIIDIERTIADNCLCLFYIKAPDCGVCNVMLDKVGKLADQFASNLCKPYFMRFRPTHDPMIMYMVDTVDNYRGGLYGFISSHAANTFAVAIYITMLFKDFRVSFSMFVWAMITSFSRIYLGVHYPGDVVCGALAGIIIGLICYSIVHYIILKMGRVSFVSSQYNRNGYRNSDMQMVVAAVNMTFVGIIIASLI